MLHRPSPLYERLLAAITRMPVIDTHEHTSGLTPASPRREPIAQLLNSYLPSDLASAGWDAADAAVLTDETVPTADKWPIFETIWRRAEHTAYGRVIKLALQDAYGQGEISLPALERMGELLAQHDATAYQGAYRAAGIRAILVDALHWRVDTVAAYLQNKADLPEPMRLMIPLRLFHVAPRQDEPTMHSWVGLQALRGWADRDITSLDEFLEAVFVVLRRFQARGAAGIKDQSAYVRNLHYELPPRADAERLFNRVLTDPRTVLGWPEAKPLDDFLFHQYMRFARELSMPVQLHTGHMAGNYNRVDKANAALLTSVLELHDRVRFDLFHANWPYAADLLFLAKNYPNVAIDMCWAPIIDPYYCVDLLRRSVGTVPHAKIHGFGGDHADAPEFSVAHLKIARACIASALAQLVEDSWLEEAEALDVAADWLHNNPNRFFGLGFATIRGHEA